METKNNEGMLNSPTREGILCVPVETTLRPATPWNHGRGGIFGPTTRAIVGVS